jgi:hypothetical protein
MLQAWFFLNSTYNRKSSTIKFIYSKKATKFFKIFPLLLTTVHTVKSKGKILQNFVAFSEYTNFNKN